MQPLHERRLGNGWDRHLMRGKHSAQPEGFLPIPGKLAAERCPVTSQQWITGLLSDMTEPSASSLGHPFHFGMASSGERLQAVMASRDSPVPVTYGIAEGSY